MLPASSAAIYGARDTGTGRGLERGGKELQVRGASGKHTGGEGLQVRGASGKYTGGEGGVKLLELQRQLSSLQFGLYLLAGGGLQVQGVSWKGTDGVWGEGRVIQRSSWGGASGESTTMWESTASDTSSRETGYRAFRETGLSELGLIGRREVIQGRSRYWWINIKANI